MIALIIHGHFYQPPRENPWTGKIDRQDSAYPYHDWNERIHDECYGSNAFAHIIGDRHAVGRTINNYENLSFNFGPTLLSWLEIHHPRTYARVLQADRTSITQHHGHGNAIAQAYGHAILPLCNARDQLTQVEWGLADFRFRFGREPESIWLPETAANDETLELLIDKGLRYAILAPGQAEAVQARDGEWHSVADNNVDTSRPYRYLHRDGSGRSLALFFYDGPLARGIAFEHALVSSEVLVHAFRQAAIGGMVNVATDGETYGHHFKFGDLTLAHALTIEAKQQQFAVMNYGEFLAEHSPEAEVRIKPGPDGEGTSWSCAHGLGRWLRDCGCHTGGEAGWNQKWRAPLRAALDFLRDEAARQFELVGGDLFADPWVARNNYIELILDHGRSREEFLNRHARSELSPPDQVRALTLMEIQRNSLLMYTSCGWFFTELSGIETIQIMKYAARLIELMDELGLPSPRALFLEMIAEARSNIPAFGSGADVYLRNAEPGGDLTPAALRISSES